MPQLTNVQWIFVILGVLYLFECVVWVRPRGVAWVIRPGDHPPRRATPLIGNDNGWLYLGGWTPSQATVVTEPPPVAVSERGVVAFVADAPLARDRPVQTGTRWNWEEVIDVTTDGPRLMIGGRTAATMTQPGMAADVTRTLRRMASLDAADRNAAIEDWRASVVEVDSLRRRLEDWTLRTGALRLLSWSLTVWIFVVGGAMYLNVLPFSINDIVVYAYLAIGLAIWFLGATTAVIAHRYLSPGDRAGRWKIGLMCFASPAVVMRASDLIARTMLPPTHPAAAAMAFGADADDDTPRLIARDFHHPLLPDAPESADAATLKILEEDRRIRWRSFPPEIRDAYTFGDPPLMGLEEVEAGAPDAAAFCPRCEQSFTRTDARCDRCGGRQAVPFGGKSAVTGQA